MTNHPGQGHVTYYWAPNDISGTAEAIVVKFYTRVDYISS